MQKINNFFTILIIVFVGIFSTSLVVYAVWLEPSLSSPGGNVSAPISSDNSWAVKLGGLMVNTGGADIGFIVDDAGDINKGLVGIGTQTPQYKLDIEGAIRLKPLASADVPVSPSNGVMYYDLDSGTFKCFENGSLKNCIGGSGGGGVSGSGSQGQIAYWTNSTTIAGNDNLRWDSTNNKLDVPAMLLNPQATTPTGVNGLMYYDSNYNKFECYSNGWFDCLGGYWELSGNNIYSNVSGNVGVGGSASEKLEVSGAIKLGNTTSSNAGTIRWTGTDFEGYNGSIWKSLTAGGVGISGTPSAGQLAFWTSSSAISGSGSLTWDDTNGTLAISGNPATNNFLQIVRPGIRTWTFKVDNGGIFSLYDNTAAATRLQIGSTGNFILGTDANQVEIVNFLKLKPYASEPSGADGSMYYNSASNKFRCYQNSAWTDCIGGTGVGGVTGSGSAGQVTFWNGTTTVSGSNSLKWDNTNSWLGVGAGLTSPASTLHVFTTGQSGVSSTASLRVGNAASYGYIGMADAASTPYLYIQVQPQNGALKLNPSGGDVVIGSASGYPVLSTRTAVPASTDCDSDTEKGRIVANISTGLLYVCMGATRGWDSVQMN